MRVFDEEDWGVAGQGVIIRNFRVYSEGHENTL